MAVGRGAASDRYYCRTPTFFHLSLIKYRYLIHTALPIYRRCPDPSMAYCSTEVPYVTNYEGLDQHMHVPYHSLRQFDVATCLLPCCYLHVLLQSRGQHGREKWHRL